MTDADFLRSLRMGMGIETAAERERILRIADMLDTVVRLADLARDSDGTRSAETACPAPVPQDCQARAESIAPKQPHD